MIFSGAVEKRSLAKEKRGLLVLKYDSVAHNR